MTEFNCPVVRINKLEPVPNSDSLEMTTMFETNCIVRKGQLKLGDLAVYIPIESVIDMTKPQFQGLGIKVSEGKEKYRVKAVRLRGTYSEGLLVPYVGDSWTPNSDALDNWSPVGRDLASEWGITKYEEPERPESGQVNSKSPQAPDMPWVPRYSVQQLVRNRDAIPEGTLVEVTEKIHGCNARFVYGKDTKGIVRLNVGSHNTWRKPVYDPLFGKKPITGGWQLTLKRIIAKVTGKKLTPNNTDDWWTIAKTLDLETKLAKFPNLVVYGEVFGKVQDLKYGCPDGVKFKIFDIYDIDTKSWFSPDQVAFEAIRMGLEKVDVLYSGPYNKSTVDPLRSGKSVIDGKTIREGIIIKPRDNKGKHIALKLVSEEYKLRKNGTEYH